MIIKSNIFLLFNLVYIMILLPSVKNVNLAVDSSQFTDINFRNMIDEIDTRILNNPHFIAPLVRLIFHDCIGGCNGCINIDNPDNRRLHFALIRNMYGYLESGYISQKFYGKSISMADYWVIAAIRAIYISSNHSELTLPIINFKYGRINCPKGTKLDEKENLPDATKNFHHVKEVFGPNKFNMTIKEMVAILGVHTLGKVEPYSSGYYGRWSIKKGYFDNSYYKQLIDKKMKYKVSPVISDFGLKYQWNATIDHCIGNNCIPKPPETPRMALNIDISLYLDFLVGDDGKPSCSNYETCKKNEEGSVYVEEFANSEAELKNTFGTAFIKLIEHGYEGKCILKDLITDEC